MWWLTLVGVISIALSFFYFFRPEQVKTLDQVGSKIVMSTEKLLEKRVMIGIVCLIAGIFLVYAAFWWW
ncbi:MAG: hypothetical protein WBB86_08010 [Candidatus Omnitrophota bacterium]